MINVLVTGVGSCGVGEGVAKAILLQPNRYRLIAANMSADAPLLYRAAASALLPPANAPDYLERVENLCRRESVQYVAPGSEPELRVLASNAGRLAGWGVVLLANPLAVVDIGDDKWRTFQHLSAHTLGTPRTALPPVLPAFLDQAGFPLVVKPRRGHASQNVFVVADRAELEAVLTYLSLRRIEVVVQEHVGTAGSEFTVGVLTGLDGTLLGSIAMRRRLMGGFSQMIEVEDFPEVRQYAEAVAASAGARGPLNIQLRWTADGGRAFEINPRFSGTSPFRAIAGFNEADLLIRHHRGERAVPEVQLGVVGMRAFDELVIPRAELERVRY
jgi:carbamoyl-phosphate synthase large subunit